MLGVTLAAADLAALRFLYGATNERNSHFLLMSVLPITNVITIVGYPYISSGGPRKRPFALGFFAGGLAAMLANVACVRIFPDTCFGLYCLPFDPFQNFCRDYLPGNVGINPDGTGYWRYYALLSLFYGWPHFLVAGLVGWMFHWVAGTPRQDLQT
jgi:hypothetical protein